ncbi:hypothetical protein E2C01_031795 [Portunus trituberculatus]|uniref:Uncharacterized protein n=1 Tax=Portunus trituberculatus TaxID=210409 RepID=A0A5B7EZ51_PORTR|nr:hypothetical protein [Portunus trituberculatus]
MSVGEVFRRATLRHIALRDTDDPHDESSDVADSADVPQLISNSGNTGVGKTVGKELQGGSLLGHTRITV